MNEQKKFWIQTLIIPFVLAVVGYFINSTLQKQQQNVEKIKLTDQILNEAFDSNNPDKAFALELILPKIINDKDYSDNIIAIINNYYTKKAEQAVQSGNDTVYNQISNSAKVFRKQGITVTDSLKINHITKKAEQAQEFEQTGLSALQEGNLNTAQQNFERADQEFPGFHSSYEIARLIKTKVADIKTVSDSVKVKDEVLKTIRKDYSWKLNTKIGK